MGTIEQDLTRWPVLQHLSEVMPFADLVFGGGMLIVIMVLHGVGVRLLNAIFGGPMRALVDHPSVWRVELILYSSVGLLLLIHLLEILVWAGALVRSGIVPDVRIAGLFAANTYTTLGSNTYALPTQWAMLAPIMAISGLFTFGWTSAVLVELVGRSQRIRNAARATRTASAKAELTRIDRAP
jgi:hypothetical protein